jgi:hypothetical protein
MSQHTENPILHFLTNKRLSLVRHILFVLVMAAIYGLLTPESLRIYAEKMNVTFEAFYIGQTFDMLVSLALIYFNLYFLFPRYFKKRLYNHYLFGIFISATAFFFASFFIQKIYVVCFGKNEKFAVPLDLNSFIEYSLFPVVFLCATTGYKVFKEWIFDQGRFANLEKEKLNAELSQLKNQVNPHFLFNTLNNLNVLVQTNPDKASDIILGLSDVLRYQIYDSQQDKVSLQKDVEIIEQYLELEKIRRDDLNTHIVKNGNFSGVLVPPLLFTNFVDNAIKHSNTRGASFINIFFKIENKQLYFEIANSKSEQKTTTESSGLGLQNVKKRLDLLYGDAHSLKIMEEAELFIIKLTIPI